MTEAAAGSRASVFLLRPAFVAAAASAWFRGARAVPQPAQSPAAALRSGWRGRPA